MGKRLREEEEDEYDFSDENTSRTLRSGLGCVKKSCGCIPYPLKESMEYEVFGDEWEDYERCVDECSKCGHWVVGPMIFEQCRFCLSEYDIIMCLERTGLLKSLVDLPSVRHYFKEYEEYRKKIGRYEEKTREELCLSQQYGFNAYQLFFYRGGKPNESAMKIVHRARKLYRLASLIDENNMAEKLVALPSLDPLFNYYISSKSPNKTVLDGNRVRIFQSGDPTFNLYPVFFNENGTMNHEVAPIVKMARRLQKISSCLTFSKRWWAIANLQCVREKIVQLIHRRADMGSPISCEMQKIEETSEVSFTIANRNRLNILELSDFPLYEIFFNEDGTKTQATCEIVEEAVKIYNQRHPCSEIKMNKL